MTKVKLALLGLGTVGSGVLTLLKKNKGKIEAVSHCQIEVTKALVRDPRKHQLWSQQVKLVTDVQKIIADPEIKIVVEVMGGLHPAQEYIKAALLAGKSVVTANKDLMAVAGPELCQLAVQKGVSLRYEASVAGGIPILNTLSTSFAGDEITQVAGIVNGTTNFILTHMAKEKQDLQFALKQAQKMGFAEADPTNDLSGKDAAYKMIILSRFAFGSDLKLGEFDYEGIKRVNPFDVQEAAGLGYTIKLIGLARIIGSHLFVTVAPMLVENKSRLGQTQDEYNAIALRSLAVGESFFYGPGAGSLPTANSVVSDLIAEICRSPRAFNPYQKERQLASPAEVRDHFYLSLKLENAQFLNQVIPILVKNKVALISSHRSKNHLVLMTALMTDSQLLKVKKALQNKDVKLQAYRILSGKEA